MIILYILAHNKKIQNFSFSTDATSIPKHRENVTFEPRGLCGRHRRCVAPHPLALKKSFGEGRARSERCVATPESVL